MGDKTGIEWTATVNADGSVTPGATWNPVTGCSKVSPGCAHCYAEGVAVRLWSSQYPPVNEGTSLCRAREFTDVQSHEDRLDQPLRWKRPRKVFVNSMSDLFHEDVPDAFIDRVFAVMALATQHTFQVLTKRVERMRAYFETRRERAMSDTPATETTLWHVWEATGEFVRGVAEAPWHWSPDGLKSIVGPWPLPNVWLGVSVENQHFAAERIPLLLQTPAAVRFLSVEPLLGPVDLSRWMWPLHWHWAAGYKTPEEAIAAGAYAERKRQALVSTHARFLDWVIVGGESGPGARPFDVGWARAIVAQCKAAGVPVFVKQLGAMVHDIGAFGDGDVAWPRGTAFSTHDPSIRLRDRKGGDITEWPEDLRVREFPAVPS